MKINSNLTISFWLRGIKNPKIKNTKTIYCRVLINNERLDFSTNQKVLEKNFCMITERIKDKSLDVTQANNVLNTISNDIIEYYSQSLKTDESITIQNLKRHLTKLYKPNEYIAEKETNDEKGLIFLLGKYKDYIDQRYRNKLIAERTMVTYKSTVNHLIDYLKRMGISGEFELKNLNRVFFYEYEKYLLGEKRLIQNTAFKYLKQTRQLFDFAFENGWITEKISVRYNVKYTNPPREILNIEEIKTLHRLELKETKNDETRDAFLFQCYTGFAYNELQRLSISNLKEMY